MKMKSTFEKRNLYSAVLSLGAASLLLAAPVFADSAMDEGSRQQAVDEQRIGEREERRSSTITVDEPAPRVQVEQPAPRVTAQQNQTQVEVETGEPEVSVNQPEPEVSIEQPEPEVSIQQPEPEVSVESAEPQVEVRQGEPEITVNTAEPEVRIIEKDASGERKDAPGATDQRAAESPASAEGSPQNLMGTRLDELEGKEVVTAAGESLGSVEDVVASRQGDEAGFVVSVGGFLGIGASEVFVPADEVEIQGDRIVWQTSQSSRAIRRSQEYQADQYQSVTDRYNTLQEVQESAALRRTQTRSQ